jgi:hypothetical protein
MAQSSVFQRAAEITSVTEFKEFIETLVDADKINARNYSERLIFWDRTCQIIYHFVTKFRENYELASDIHEWHHKVRDRAFAE